MYIGTGNGLKGLKSLDVVVGLQYGDESKGRTSHYIATHREGRKVIVRWNGGPNAGHTIYDTKGNKIVCRHFPAAAFCEADNIVAIIFGPNVVIDVDVFIEELKLKPSLAEKVWIHPRAVAITEGHKAIDSEEYQGRIGTTGKGIGPAYMASVGRNVTEFARDALVGRGVIGKIFNDTPIEYLLKDAQHIIAEGAQATGLDILHGTYPFVTSSECTAPSFFSSMGFGSLINKLPEIDYRVHGVMKPYTTRVGAGPLRAELSSEDARVLAFIDKAGEYGSVTGRRRRIAPVSSNQILSAMSINGVTDLVIAKFDLAKDFNNLLVELDHANHYWHIDQESFEKWCHDFDCRPAISNGPKRDNWLLPPCLT